MHWQTARFTVDLDTPKVMGIVNVTPDSFSDGGQHATRADALAHCEQLLRDGADMLDIGGESTRPGAAPVDAHEELRRILPVVRHALTLGVPVSVDTYKPSVMRTVLDLGVDIINDVWALRWFDRADGLRGDAVIAAHSRCGVCLMHMHREPTTMQAVPMDGDAVPQVRDFLQARASQLMALGVDRRRICVDPGIGFGKTVAQNFSLLAHQQALADMGFAVLAGWSRKSSLAAVVSPSPGSAASVPVQDRIVPSVAAALLAVQRGAHVVRVHDVKETVQALRVWAAVQAQQ